MATKKAINFHNQPLEDDDLETVNNESELQLELNGLQRQKTKLLADISKQEKEITEAKTALELIEKPLPVPVVSGVLGVFDSLKTLTDSQESEADKQAQIDNFKVAIEKCETHLKRLNADLQTLEVAINKTEDNINFENEYLPHFERLKTGYTKRSDALKLKEKSVQNDLSKYRGDRDAIEMYLSGKKISLHNLPLGVNPSEYLEKIKTNYIPNLERQLADIQAMEISDDDLLNDPDFKSWLQARVNVDKAVSKLVASQQQYIKDLQQFKDIGKNNQQGLDFDLYDLPYTLNVVEVVDQKLTLARVEI